eukprot:CAMPEP_0174892090 /NCGR_PEP_ID=MMETSP0167-20121228/7111_1 /TAXON_ID=38298 /ORGANISM="Rhodella maculata, Strain CCMP736" /LENGTH=139 /DNA_ID=CAMNT_0016130483 /DNA_START=288 /DNA_END=707 /DNA_ORIENTATION=+
MPPLMACSHDIKPPAPAHLRPLCKIKHQPARVQRVHQPQPLHKKVRHPGVEVRVQKHQRETVEDRENTPAGVADEKEVFRHVLVGVVEVVDEGDGNGGDDDDEGEVESGGPGMAVEEHVQRRHVGRAYHADDRAHVVPT